MVARPVWVGVMATEFKKITGSEIDFDAIARNDIEYMDKYENQLDQARTIADRKVVDMASTKNPFVTSPSRSHRSTQFIDVLNKYMRGFSMTEYEFAADAIMHGVKGGKISREEAAQGLEGVLARAAAYRAVQAKIGFGLAGLVMAGYAYLKDDDKSEEDIKGLIAANDYVKALSKVYGNSPEDREASAKLLLHYFFTRNPQIYGTELGDAITSGDKETEEQLKGVNDPEFKKTPENPTPFTVPRVVANKRTQGLMEGAKLQAQKLSNQFQSLENDVKGATTTQEIEIVKAKMDKAIQDALISLEQYTGLTIENKYKEDQYQYDQTIRDLRKAFWGKLRTGEIPSFREIINIFMLALENKLN